MNEPRIKICSFKDMDREGSVELHIDSPNKYNHPKLMARSFYDTETDTYWGIPTKVDKDGNVEWEPLVLDGDVVRFNLKDNKDAMRWHIFRNSPWVKGSNAANRTGGMDVRYKIFDINKEAEAKIVKVRNTQTATEWILGLSEEMIKGLSRIYGLAPEVNSLAVITSALLEKAQKNPDQILNKKDRMSETNLMIVLKRAESLQIVQNIPGIGFKYENQLLGVNENVAVEYLRTHAETAVGIDQISKEKERTGKPVLNRSGGAEPSKSNKTWVSEKPKPEPQDELQV